jgi:PKD repeat protein
MKKLILLLTLITTLNSYSQVADFMASSTTICSGGSITFTNLSTGATSYAWTFIDGASSQTSTLTNPVITYSTPGNYAVILTASNSTTSDTEIKTGYITVIPAATITLTSGAGSNNQSVCANTPFSITYAVTGATGATVTFSPANAGATSSFAATASGGTLTISGTPTSSFTYSVTTTGGSCAPINASGSVSIIPAPILSLSSAASTANQTVCLNTNIASINYSFGGSATGVNISGLPAGVFNAQTSLSATIVGTPTAVGTYNFQVVTTGGACPAVTLSGQIIVDTSHAVSYTHLRAHETN